MKPQPVFSDTILLNIHEPGLLAENLRLKEIIKNRDKTIKQLNKIVSAQRGIYTLRNK